MEDALVLNKNHKFDVMFDSLNPCFNGRCTRTVKAQVKEQMRQVLILVLMEDALVHY